MLGLVFRVDEVIPHKSGYALPDICLLLTILLYYLLWQRYEFY